MKIALVTDAWEPQVNGVVRTLTSTARELRSMGHFVELLTPLEFRTLPCPSYPDIRLSLFPGAKVTRRLTDFDPDAIHIATEGPLGIAARRFVALVQPCIQHDPPLMGRVSYGRDWRASGQDG